MKTTLCKIGLVAFGVVALSCGASAKQITGEIHFMGAFNPIDGSGNTATLGDASGLDFINPVVVVLASGDYAAAGITPFQNEGTINSFYFEPALSPDPVDPLWSVNYGGGTFSFRLDDITVDLQSANQLNLTGTGVLLGTGFDETPGTWSFQGGGSSMFSFRADSTSSDGSGGANVVIDGGATAMMLGMALMGLGIMGRRPRRK